MSLPLSGIRVLDLTRFFVGPFCTQILADFGAEVIKIEDCKGGDPGRWAPPLIKDSSALFYTVNRNKKSITLNLRTEQGRDIFRRLAKISDVVVEAFRPGVMEKMGLDYDELAAINPRLIYCAISGYGHSGPLRERGGHDINFLAMAGVTELTASRDGKPAISSAQIASGAGGAQNAVIAILLALLNRQQTGKGQFCDISMVDGASSLLAYALGEWSGSSQLPERGRGMLSGGSACYNLYRTADDRYISVGAIEPKFWERFCSLIARPDLIPLQWDPKQQDWMIAELDIIFAQKSLQEWRQLFDPEDICVSPVLNMEELSQHPQMKAREMIHMFPSFKGTDKTMALTGTAVKLSATPGQPIFEFPDYGQHTTTIMKELGYDQQELEHLKDTGII
ncbi:MAG TPA: CoA transferase [Syntrophomonadaceae bacterium]|nr:CoA transferase [Syntrophomonadaceae bacterium]